MIDEKLILGYIENWKQMLGDDFQDSVIKITLEILAKKIESFPLVEMDPDMEELTTEMAEYICDMCCDNLQDVRCQEDADRICGECKLDKFIHDICNKYNCINTFVGTEIEKLLIENSRLKKELGDIKNEQIN